MNLLFRPSCSSVQRCPASIGHLLSLLPDSSMCAPGCDSLRLHSRVPTAHAREALRFVNGPVVVCGTCHVSHNTTGGWFNSAEVGAGTFSAHLLYYVCSLWSSPVLCLQSLVISCTMSAVSGHLLYYVRNLWSSPVLCPQSLVISCTMSAVSGHLLYYVRSLWSSLYYVRSLWSSPVLCP
ncbi:unnamed protein product [Staurois parvus]|uniref:Uncharacterized protein n=1 Tax=Staurois parvus TaxID=386267 RepID=A0ABN9GJU1_9NEOB|nr:unnamed protein product [Staurois parvus]